MKRIISLVLAVSMVLSVFSTVFAAKKYTDLTGENAKYAGAVEALTELGVVDGFTDNTFGPLKELTRAQLAKMLVICLGLGDSVESLTGKTVFSDVAASHWAAGYVNAAAQSKVITGYPDGTFKPEKNVSYAEAFTMALRALGYGNVVEAEGTWPTAYMLKAVELELTDDMEGTIVAGNPATRGNTAILLWNMLRTPMWKIYEESQGNGMTLYANGDYMLNVKFPKYTYAEEIYLDDVEIKDNTEVRATVKTENGRETLTAKVPVDTDLSRLVENMKLTVLVKDYQDEDKAQFLTMTPEYTFVEGLVTDDAKLEEKKVKIEGEEYKFKDATLEVADTEFVVVEVDGTKIVDFGGAAVAKKLPNDAREATKSEIKKIDEDALVIIDGKWATRDDIEEGDIITELDEDWDGTYYMVARERTTGEFEALTYEKDSKRRAFIEADGEEYRVLDEDVTRAKFAYDNEDPIDDAKEKLLAKKADNDYVGREVEICFNYLGLVWRLYFEEGENADASSRFYVVVSDGVQTRYIDDEKVLSIKLANADNPEGQWYTFKKSVKDTWFYGSAIEEDEVYSGDPVTGVFVWAKVNDDNQITAMAVVRQGLGASGDSGDVFNDDKQLKPYKDDFAFVEFGEEDYDKTDSYIRVSGEGEFKITDDTVVLEAVPVVDEDDVVESFEFRVAEDKAKALNAAEGGIVAYDTKAKINQADGEKKLAKFIFLTSDAEESELMVGKVDKTRVGTKGSFATVDGTEYEIDMEDDGTEDVIDAKASGDPENLDKAFILFTETNNDKIKIKDILDTKALVGAPVVIAKSGALVKLSGDPVELDTEIDDDTNKSFRKYDVVHINASENKDGIVEFTDGEYKGTGIKVSEFTTGDRVIINSGDKIIYIVTVDGCDEKDTLALTTKGDVEIIPDEGKNDSSSSSSTTPATSGREISSGDWTVVAVVESSATERFATMAEGEILAAVEGDGVKSFFEQYGGTLTLNPFDTPWEVTTPFDLDEAPTVASRCQVSYKATNNKITVTIK